MSTPLSPAALGPAQDAFLRERILVCYPEWAEAAVSRLEGGLINQTFLLARSRGGATDQAVLQHLAPIFSPLIHENIRAVTERLAAAGLATPRLIPTRDAQTHIVVDVGEQGHAGGAGIWRLSTFVEGCSFDVVSSPAQARAAGGMVAAFHGALVGLPHDFVGLRRGVHDTPTHLQRLQDAVGQHGAHRLFAEVEPFARQLLTAAAGLEPLPATAPLVGHGDLKFNNVLFAGRAGADRDRAVCLIDLDTVGPLLLAHELGDAWRSWCNRAGEDASKADLDLEVLASSWDGYVAAFPRPVASDQRRALLLGVEWISLELAARFLADALEERYFGWNAAKFSTRGEHNLLRARGQWSLHEALVASRAARAKILGVAA